MSRSHGPRIPVMEVARWLRTATLRDDATCLELARKTYSGAVDGVRHKNELFLICHDFVGPLIQMKEQVMSQQGDYCWIGQLG